MKKEYPHMYGEGKNVPVEVLRVRNSRHTGKMLLEGMLHSLSSEYRSECDICGTEIKEVPEKRYMGQIVIKCPNCNTVHEVIEYTHVYEN